MSRVVVKPKADPEPKKTVVKVQSRGQDLNGDLGLDLKSTKANAAGPKVKIQGQSVNLNQGPVATIKPKVKIQSQSAEVDTAKPKIRVQGQSQSVNSGQGMGTRPTIKINSGAIPTADSYKQMSQEEHVYAKSGMYIGSDTDLTKDDWVYDLNEAKMVQGSYTFIEGIERCYLEILSNASDNCIESRKAGIDPKKIIITMTNSTIVIRNYGIPIAVEEKVVSDTNSSYTSNAGAEKRQGTVKKYCPELVLGTLLTSSNYKEERSGAGTNGIGAKAVNIYSKYFKVEVGDSFRKLKYVQSWENNMKVRGEPVITTYNSESSYVEITYVLDFERFKLRKPVGDQGGYTDIYFGLFARHAIDASFNSKIPVTFNGVTYDYSQIKKFAKLYMGDAVKTGIIHYQWPPGTNIIHKGGGYQISESGCSPLVELLIMDTPRAAEQVSFVNCMMTREGGVHVDAAVKEVSDVAVKYINDDIISKLSKIKGGDKLKNSYKFTLRDVKPHISVFLSVRVTNPEFASQTKTRMTGPNIKINIDQESLKNIPKWKLMEQLYITLDQKELNNMKKTDGKQKRRVNNKNIVDANFAGGPKRGEAIGIVCEGISAQAYVDCFIGEIPSGRDRYGCLALRGKGLNVSKASTFRLSMNREINLMKEMLGLREGTDYLVEKEFKTLRYGGGLLIMADSDVDGKHITGLILNYFHERFPSLLARGYVMNYRTPIIRVTRGNVVHKFYLNSEYNKWKNENLEEGDESWDHHYYKGLGTSTKEDVKEDCRDKRIVHCFYDEDAPAMFQLAFDAKFADKRKQWIDKYRHDFEIDDIVKQPISWFLKHEMVEFSVDNLQRAIPRMLDGFKESNRKVMFGAFQRWPHTGKTHKKFKVAQLAAHVSDISIYHHGETILNDVIIKMADDFVGSNNLPYFATEGMFGKRFKGGKDAGGARYLHTMLRPSTYLIFRKEDQPILTARVDEGKNIEPLTYYPIIPNVLANGAKGVATGYSTNIPNHNPIDIIDWYIKKLSGAKEEDLPEVYPWYCGFKGKIEIIDRRKKKDTIDGKKIKVLVIKNGSKLEEKEVEEAPDEDLDLDLQLEQELKDPVYDSDVSDDEDQIDPDEEEFLRTRPLLSMVTYGEFHIGEKGKIIITELPIGLWTNTYELWLRQLIEEKKLSSYRMLTDKDTVYFELDDFTGARNYTGLRLKKTVGMTNMHLLNSNGKPILYNTVKDILVSFYSERLRIYSVRKNYHLGQLLVKIQAQIDKLRFTEAVVNKEIKIIGTKVKDIKERLKELNIPLSVYDKSSTSNLSHDGAEKIKEKIAKLQAEYDAYNRMTEAQIWLSELTPLRDSLVKTGLYTNKKTIKVNKEVKMIPGTVKPKIVIKS